MVFLQLAVGGHLLLFVVRTRHSIFMPPYPSAPLFLAIVATQIVAVLICGYGILVPKLPWAGDRRGLGLFARLDGRHRHRQAALLSHRRDEREAHAQARRPLAG